MGYYPKPSFTRKTLQQDLCSSHDSDLVKLATSKTADTLQKYLREFAIQKILQIKERIANEPIYERPDPDSHEFRAFDKHLTEMSLQHNQYAGIINYKPAIRMRAYKLLGLEPKFTDVDVEFFRIRKAIKANRHNIRKLKSIRANGNGSS